MMMMMVVVVVVVVSNSSKGYSRRITTQLMPNSGGRLIKTYGGDCMWLTNNKPLIKEQPRSASG